MERGRAPVKWWLKEILIVVSDWLTLLKSLPSTFSPALCSTKPCWRLLARGSKLTLRYWNLSYLFLHRSVSYIHKFSEEFVFAVKNQTSKNIQMNFNSFIFLKPLPPNFMNFNDCSSTIEIIFFSFEFFCFYNLWVPSFWRMQRSASAKIRNPL